MSGTNNVFTLRFRPEAWVNDYAVEVDAEGPTMWNPSASFVKRLIIALQTREYYDFLVEDPATPSWVRDWRGPFSIDVICPQEVIDALTVGGLRSFAGSLIPATDGRTDAE